MSPLESILLLTFLGSIAGLAGGALLLINNRIVEKAPHYLASFAAGTLIGAAFFDLLPEAVADSPDGVNFFPWIVVGILIFFLLERYLHGFHQHEETHEHHKEGKTTVPLIVVGDTVHNFVDGAVIAATFMADPQVGLITTFAVLAHELPQEIGDFGLLLHKGVSRIRVLIINFLSACSAFAGAILTYSIGSALEKYIPVMLTLTTGFFIYIALSDLMPEIQYEKSRRVSTLQTLAMVGGIILIWFVVNTFEHR